MIGKKSSYYWFFLLLILAVPFFAANCGNGDGDGDDIQSETKGLYRCKDCGEVLDWLHETAILRMEREIEVNRQYTDDDIVSDDDTWWDDDTWGDDDMPVGDDDAAGGDDDGVSDDDMADDDAASDDDGYDDDDQSGDDNEAGDDDDDSYSDTNTQEEGVDEADIVKQDADYLYLVSGGWFMIFDVKPEAQTQQIASIDIEGNVIDMYLYGNLALVFSTPVRSKLDDNVWPDLDHSTLSSSLLKFTVIDHTNKADPQVIREMYMEGAMTGSRRVGASARIVINGYKGGPYVQTWLDNWWEYGSQEELDAAYDALVEQNKQIINDAGLEEWIPRYYDIVHLNGDDETNEGFLVNCEDHYRPLEPQGNGTLSVVTFNFDNPEDKQVDISIIADGYIVYASQENLYVTGNVDDAWNWAADRENFEDMSQVHMFDIASQPDEAIYLATGDVKGYALNQFSMSEYQGYLRIATTYGGWWNNTPERNGVFVLQRDGYDMNVVGQAADIATNETIYAARFLGDKGFLVTFEQTDPLFTIDLSDPLNPAVIGELEVPGFSTYLHPMADGYLMAIGEGGDFWGSNGGVALSIFDVSDFANPSMIHHVDLGDWDTYSEAKYDHHAFLYSPELELVAIPLQYYDYGYDDDTWWDDDTWGDDDTWSDDDVFDDDTMTDDDKDDDEPVTDDDMADDDDDDDDDDTYGDESFSGIVVFHVTAQDGFSELAKIDHSGMTAAEGSDYYYGQPMPRRSTIHGDYLFTISDLGLIVTEIGNWDENVREINLPWQEQEWDDWYGDDDTWDGGGAVEPDEP